MVVCVPSTLSVGTVLAGNATLIPSVLGTLKAVMGDTSVLCVLGCSEGCKGLRMLVESQSGNLMPHLLTAGPFLPCADFPKQGNPPGMNTDAEPVWCWGG